MVEKSPFDGPLLVEVEGVHHALAYDMATSLLVVAWDEKTRS